MSCGYYLLDPAGKRVLDLGANGALWRIAGTDSWEQPPDEPGPCRGRLFRRNIVNAVDLPWGHDPAWIAAVIAFLHAGGRCYALALEGGEEVPWCYPFGESPDFAQPWMDRPDWTITKVTP